LQTKFKKPKNNIMQLILTTTEKRELLTTCLQYFYQSLSMWEHTAKYADKTYLKARQMLITTCREDVYAEMILAGAGINIVDDQDEDNCVLFNLEKFDQNFQACDAYEIIMLLLEKDYDFTNADNVLQTLIFGEVVYG